ncbi:unnamed protein product [Prorocentrum cordatum]|uniref:Chromate transporter n=1 Tax=Prorocentrum cordatum TaxID=2364126 RepID=A0ABN9T5T9_9DINO|nr:unnamed protein product [Polarella glacialis]
MAREAPLLEREAGPSLSAIASNFFWLGLTAFGGPPVHISMFKKRFCEDEDLRWLSEERFQELFAMANCLPGPSSTQVGFAIGVTKKGVVGGLVSGFAFILPGAIMMTALGFASSAVSDKIKDPHSPERACAIACSAVGVSLVFSAVSGLVKKFVFSTKDTGKLGFVCCITAAMCLLVSPTPAWLNPVLIFAGGMVTIASPVHAAANQNEAASHDDGRTGLPISAARLVFLGYFVLAAWTIHTDTYDHGWVMPFLNAGMFVWGGGPVVLPMLMTYPGGTVSDLTPTFIDPTVFLTGIALAEMMPGPVFNMSCFLGVQLALAAGWWWPSGVAICWLGLMGPGIALIFGAVPVWDQLKQFAVYSKALPGLNAAAVGLLVQTVFVVYGKLDEKSKDTAIGCSGARAIALLSYCAIDMAGINTLKVVLAFGALGFAVASMPADHMLA